MGSPEGRFVYLEDEAQRERQEISVPVVNFMEAQGLPTRASMRRETLSGNEAVTEHFEPLQQKDAPNIIFGIPHAGELAPTDLYNRMTDEGHKTLPLIDVGTPELFTSDKIPSVEYNFSRFVTDPNRAPDFTPSAEKVAGKAPGKILWLEGATFKPMYKEGEAPDGEEIRSLAEKFYLPYYNKMMTGIGMLTDRRESRDQRVLVIDGHSFPITENMKEYYDHYGIKDAKTMPMFILGTRDGESCDQDIVDALAEALTRNFDELEEDEKQLVKASITGDVVGINQYVKGVHNVRFYGARDQGVNAIQIECNESAYVDRDKMPDMPGYQKWDSFKYNQQKMAILQRLIEKSALDIDPILKKH